MKWYTQTMVSKFCVTQYPMIWWLFTRIFFTSKLYPTKQSKTKNIKIPLQAFLLLIPIKRKSMWRLHNSWTLHIIELRCQCILAYNNFHYQTVKNAQKYKILLAMVFGYSKCESGHVTQGRCWCETEYR